MAAVEAVLVKLAARMKAAAQTMQAVILAERTRTSVMQVRNAILGQMDRVIVQLQAPLVEPQEVRQLVEEPLMDLVKLVVQGQPRRLQTHRTEVPEVPLDKDSLGQAIIPNRSLP